MEQQVINLFHASIQAKMQAGEELAPTIARASQVMVDALLHENRILACGNGISAGLAQIFASCLANRFVRERPGLPALALGTDTVTQTAIATDQSFNDIYAKQIRTLGQPGDLLLVLASDDAGNLVQAISAAHDRDIQVIALTGKSVRDTASLLDNRDLELRVASGTATHVHEVHLLALFCLCDLIDQQLFGSHL